jgi:hypothetical protein
LAEQQPWYHDERLLFAVIAILLFSTLVWRGTEPTPPSKKEQTTTDAIPYLPSPPLLTTYSPEAIDYFMDIAFGAEYGNLSEVIRKWPEDIRIRVSGKPTQEDMQALRDVVEEINSHQDAITLSLDRFGANIVAYFIPEAGFKDVEPHYEPSNPGFFWVHWRDYELYKARVLIDSAGLNQADRSSLIREELTQALGLMDVSSRYTDSIFNDYSDHYVEQYAAIDKLLIEMLYRPEIKPGMNQNDVQTILYSLRDTSRGKLE